MTNINVNPGQGQVNDVVQLSGLGFIASHSVTITFGTSSLPAATRVRATC